MEKMQDAPKRMLRGGCGGPIGAQRCRNQTSDSGIKPLVEAFESRGGSFREEGNSSRASSCGGNCLGRNAITIFANKITAITIHTIAMLATLICMSVPYSILT